MSRAISSGRARFGWALLPILVLASSTPAGASWVQDGNPATSASGVTSQPQAVTDGAGGVIVVYQQDDAGDMNLYAQRYNADGDLLWGPTGVSVTDAPEDEELHTAVADGIGGVVIAWARLDALPYLYVQWLRPDGSARFPDNGLQVNPNNQGDGIGEALHMLATDRFMVAYTMNGVFNPAYRDVYAQAFDSTGTMLWFQDGVMVSNFFSDKANVAVAPDNAGGVVLAWQDFRNGSDWDIYAQRLDANALKQWTGDQPVVTAPMSQLRPQLVPIGALGTMVIFEDRQGASPDIAAGRLRETGTMAWGIYVCDAAGIQDTPVACSDGNDGAMIAWEDRRDGNRDIYAMRVTGGGSTSGWPNDGEIVANASFEETQTAIARDGADGAVIAWVGDLAGDVLHASRISGSGDNVWLQWSPICLAGGSRFSPVVVVGSGDFLVAWGDSRPGGVYAQRLDRTSGLWGIVTPPVIASVNDSPGDGGGRVDITWQKSGRDDGLLPGILEYHVFRALDPDSLWTLVGSVTAAAQPVYAMIGLPTTADNVTNYFRVDAMTGLGLAFQYPSQPVGGMSIDDPPNAPLNLSVDKIGSWYYLQWQPPGSCQAGAPCDVVAYRVYRRAVVPPGATRRTSADWEFLGETNETQFTDETVAPGGGYEWGVAAMDAMGQEGAMSMFTIDDTSTGVGDAPPARLVLAPNAPNPFARSTELVFALPDERDVRLDVYDVAGRRVLTRELGRLPAGWNQLRFDARALRNGVYFYRLTAGADVVSRKMVVQR